MKLIRLISIPESADDPAAYRVYDSQGAVLERGEITFESARPRPECRDVALVPGSDVAVRWVEPSSGTRAQQTAAALWRVREDLATPIDRVSAALGPMDDEGRVVAVTAVGLLNAWRDYFAALHLSPVAVVPNSLVLSPPEDPHCLASAQAPGGLAIRAKGLAAVVQPDMLEALSAARTVVPADAEYEAGLAKIALEPPIDLRGEAPRTLRLRDWRLAAGLAAALAVSPLIVDAAQAVGWSMRAAQAQSRTQELASRRWPDLATASDAEVAQRLSTAAGPGDLSAGVAALFAAVESVPGAELDAFGVEADDGMNAVISYPAFQDLDQLNAALRAAGFAARDLSTVEDEGRIVSDIRLERAP